MLRSFVLIPLLMVVVYGDPPTPSCASGGRGMSDRDQSNTAPTGTCNSGDPASSVQSCFSQLNIGQVADLNTQFDAAANLPGQSGKSTITALCNKVCDLAECLRKTVAACDPNGNGALTAYLKAYACSNISLSILRECQDPRLLKAVLKGNSWSNCGNSANGRFLQDTYNRAMSEVSTAVQSVADQWSLSSPDADKLKKACMRVKAALNSIRSEDQIRGSPCQGGGMSAIDSLLRQVPPCLAQYCNLTNAMDDVRDLAPRSPNRSTIAIFGYCHVYTHNVSNTASGTNQYLTCSDTCNSSFTIIRCPRVNISATVDRATVNGNTFYCVSSITITLYDANGNVVEVITILKNSIPKQFQRHGGGDSDYIFVDQGNDKATYNLKAFGIQIMVYKYNDACLNIVIRAPTAALDDCGGLATGGCTTINVAQVVTNLGGTPVGRRRLLATSCTTNEQKMDSAAAGSDNACLMGQYADTSIAAAAASDSQFTGAGAAKVPMVWWLFGSFILVTVFGGRW